MSVPVRLYCITCRTNRKMYVGITKRSLDVRWLAHVNRASRAKTKFHSAIKKYGFLNFDVVELFLYPSLEEALDAEMNLIAALDLMSSGYNMSPGGECNPLDSLEVREKVAAAHRGKKQSEATKEKRAAALRGRKRPEEVKERIRATLMGRRFSPETLRRMALAAQKRFRPHEVGVILI